MNIRVVQRALVPLAGFVALACGLYPFSPAVMPQYKIYFGDNHAHTSYSDGLGARKPGGIWPPGPHPTPADAFSQARDSGLSDYLVISEHSGYAPGIYFNLDASMWESARKMADDQTKEGSFISIAGLEYSPASSDSHLEGHMNIFNSGAEFFPEPRGQEEFYDMLAHRDGIIAQWNHPSLQYARNNFKQFAGWTPARNRAIAMLEIYSNDQGRMESAYQLALDRNWKICPAANSDTHTANWILGYETRAAVLAKDLTRESIYDAWRNRRCYATENRNLRISYQINGYPMGSSIPLASRYTALLQVEDPDTQLADEKIRTIELVTNRGAIVASRRFDGHKVEWTNPIASTGSSAYYYARITNEKGQMAWTAPIWVPASRMTVTPIPGVTDQLNLAWAGTRTGEEGYQIWRSTAVDTLWQLWKTVEADTSNYVDETVHAGTKYFYKVRPYNGARMYSFSEAASATTASRETVAPTVPTGLTLLSQSRKLIEFVFSPSTDDQLLMGYGMVRNGVDVPLGGFAGFTERLVSGKTMVKASDVDYPGRGHTIEPDTTYRYQIYAVDWAGNKSGLSETFTVKTNPLAGTPAPGTP